MGEKGAMMALDIGTTKVAAVIGKRSDDDKLEISGIGCVESGGLYKGGIVDMPRTVDAVARAVEEAELMSGLNIPAATVGIAGSHVRSMNSRGVVMVTRGDREISISDRDRAIDAAKPKMLPVDQDILHCIPHEFFVDYQGGIKDPSGMSGSRLEVDVHLVTVHTAGKQNVVKAVERSGYQPDELVLESLASSEGVLTDDEKELGVMVVDIGGGTTDICLYMQGSPWLTCAVPLGGENITRDIACGFHTSLGEAEEIKRSHGACSLNETDLEQEFVIRSVGGHKSISHTRRELAAIIEPRMREILTMVQNEIRKQGMYERVGAGIVITGGTSLVSGTDVLAEEIFKMPARIGYPVNISGLADIVNSPIYATGIGLLNHGFSSNGSTGMVHGSWGGNGQNVMADLFSRIRIWASSF